MPEVLWRRESTGEAQGGLQTSVCRVRGEFETLKLHGHSADMRHIGTLSERSLYDSWTQNLLQNPPHTCPTADAPGVAACDKYICRACQACPDYLTSG